MTPRRAANPPYKLPPPIFDARCKACWFTTGLIVLVIASFWSLDLQWAQFFSIEAAHSMLRFLGEFFPPDLKPAFVRQVVVATWETLAMSALGTVLAAAIGLLLALPASRLHAGDAAWARTPTRLLLNALRSVPELVWASLLLIAAGLGPFAGTLALAAHTAGVLGRLFAEAIENAPAGPGAALRTQGARVGQVFPVRHPAASAAATDELHPVPLGEQHPRGCGARRGGGRRPGATTVVSHGVVPHEQDGNGAARDAGACRAGRRVQLWLAPTADAVARAPTAH